MMDILNRVISAVQGAGIDCSEEYAAAAVSEIRSGIHAFAGIKKIRMERLRDGLSDVSAQVRVTVQCFDGDEEALRKKAEKTVIPAVLNCGEEIYCAEVSETFYEAKTGRLYCEILFDIRRCGYDVCV